MKKPLNVTISEEIIEQLKSNSDKGKLSEYTEQIIRLGLQAESTTETGKDLLKDLFRVARILNEKARAKEIIFREPENK